MMVVSESCVIVKTDNGLNNLMSRYECSSVNKLADILWFSYGITLIDDRPNAMYSQVNAQHSIEFFNEEMTQSELNEIIENKSIYGASQSS